MRRSFFRVSIFALALAAAGGALAQSLPELTLDRDATTVSGLSSGANMAMQLHVAFSRGIAGAGIVAGGPYYCARNSVFFALNRCMGTIAGEPDETALLAYARDFSATGQIDPLSGLSGDRVYLFSGTEDGTVTTPVMESAREFYLAAGVAASDVRYEDTVPAGHALLALGAPNPCATTGPPFINDCGIDQAGDILSWLYGDLAAPRAPEASRLRTFAQDAFLADPEAHGMDETGFVYVPEACERGETCRLHIVFHGCEQTPDQIGDLYARTSGYNAVAEANDIVVLYPQAQAIPSPLLDPFGGNPKGCWDWWGYDDAAYFMQQGRQMAAVAGMAASLGAPIGSVGEGRFCTRHEGSNWTHWRSNRAEFCGFYAICARGSGHTVGTLFMASTLFESPEGFFSTTSCE